MADKWAENDTLRVMTTKFNNAVDELIALQKSSKEVNTATTQRLTEMSEDIARQFEEVGVELENRVTKMNKADVGLSNVDNTADIDKPVSTATQQAIEDATEQMVTSEEVSKIEILEGHNPEITGPVKTYIEERIQEIAAKDGAVSYEIATSRVAGVVRASDDVVVNKRTGAMSVPELAVLHGEIDETNTNLDTTNENLDIERKRIDQLMALPEGSTTADAELFDIRLGYNGEEYESSGTAVRQQFTDIHAKVEELNSAMTQRVDDLEDKYIDVADINDREKLAGSTWSSIKIDKELSDIKDNLVSLMVLKDTKTGLKYNLAVNNGKLEIVKLEETETE